MNDLLDRVLVFVYLREGGWSNRKNDKGKKTMMGVTQKNYDAWNHDNGRASGPVKDITKEEADRFYRERYWNRVHGDRLPWPVCLVVMDSAVIAGPGTSAQWLQEASGATVDGIIGPKTEAAARLPGVWERMCDIREAHHRARVVEDPTQVEFLQGWINRVNLLRTACKAPL